MIGGPCPCCPRCGSPPTIQLDPEQAFCGNEACDVLAWNPQKTLTELEANVNIIDIRNGEKT